MIQEIIYDGIDAFEHMEQIERNETKNYYKTYYLRNKEWIKRQSSNWHKNNPERVKELRGKKVICDICQKEVRKYYLKKHISKMHK